MIVNHPKTKNILGLDKISTNNNNMFLKENQTDSIEKVMEYIPGVNKNYYSMKR